MWNQRQRRTGADIPTQRLPRSGVTRVFVLLAVSLLLLVGIVVVLNRPASDGDVAADTAAVSIADSESRAAVSATGTAAEFVDRNPGYAGIDSCVACHAERVAEYRDTHHFHTCRIPTVADLPPAFSSADPDAGIYPAPFAGTEFRMQYRDGKFYQTTVRQTQQGPVPEQSTRIDLVLGAGQTDDVYLAWHDDGRMSELPIAWLWPQDNWASSHFLNRHGSGDYSRPMTVRCLECHNTWIQHEPGTVNLYRRQTAMLGVTCENCHGPAQDHVAWHTEHPDQTTAQAIVQPASLPRERLIEVCTQCHSNAVTHRRPPFSYQPGEPLEQYYRTQLIAHPEDDHVANQIQHLRTSRCFELSPEMTCITCHDPHQNQGPRSSSADACRQCHQPHDCGQQPLLPAAVQSACIDCHMPARIKINVKFRTLHDNFVPATRRSSHHIAVDPVARDEVLLDYYRSSGQPQAAEQVETLRSRLVEHWLQQAETHRQQHRYLAAIADLREAVAVSDEPELQEQLSQLVEIQTQLYDQWATALHLISTNQLSQAVPVLQQILAIRPTDAETHSKLGTIYAMSGQTDKAEQHLRTAIDHDPNNAEGYGVLGRLAWIERRFEDALGYWQQAEQIDPRNAQIQFDLGTVLLQLNRPQEAVSHLQQAQSINPNRSDISNALATAHQQLAGQ